MPLAKKLKGTLDYYVSMATKGGEDAKLESSKIFLELSEEKKFALVADVVDALFHLIETSENVEIIKNSLMAMVNLCKEKNQVDYLISEKNCFRRLASAVSFHNVPCQILATRCIGLLAKYPTSGIRFVSDGGLLPILCSLKPDQDTEMLIEICKTLATCNIRGECATRIVEVWGLESLGELISKFIKEKDSKSIEILTHLSLVLSNLSRFKSIGANMFKNEKLQLINLLTNVLSSSHVTIEAKRAAAKTCYNLVNNQYINDNIVVNEVLISLLMRKHFETDYLFKHTVVKTLDCAVKECIELRKEELMIRIIKKHQNLSFIEWIINSIGCDNVQIIVLKVFIASKWAVYDNENVFSKTFLHSLLVCMRETISTTVRRVCDEVLYQFCNMERFKKEIIEYRGVDILIPQLTFKEIKSKLWGVKALARIMTNRDYALSFVKNYGIVKPAVKCFMITPAKSPEYNDIFMSTLIIISAISETTEFREYFLQSGAINKLLDILERSDRSEHKKLIYCLNIIIAYVNSANYESSGNANLKIVSEKRLCRVIENVTSKDFSLSGRVVLLIQAYSQHSNSPIFDFWNILYNKSLEVIRCNEDYNSYLYQRITCFQMLTSILSKPYIFSNLNPEVMIGHYLNIFAKSNSLSYLKETSAKGLLYFCKQSPAVFRTVLLEYEEDLVALHKEFTFGNNTCFSNVGSFREFLTRYLIFFKKEKTKKIRKYLIFAKMHRFLLFLLAFVKIKNENAQFVDTLISQASSKFMKMEGEKRTINPLMYIPLAHKHHYDIDTAVIGQNMPYQPSSNDTQKRLKELVLQKYNNNTPSNSPPNRRRSNSGFSFGTRSSSICSTHSPVVLMSEKFSSNTFVPDDISILDGTGEFGSTVQSNIKKTQKKDSNHSPTPTTSLLEMWQDEYGSKEVVRETNFKSFRTGSSASTLPHLNSTMSTSTTPLPHQGSNRSHNQRPASALSFLKTRKEVTDLNPELEKRYLKKSKEMGIIKPGTTFPFENVISSTPSKYKFY